ncbi:hypothetical protein C0J56_03775 [Pseudomonas fluorescens]|nr:hypothetical protein C0J56_03775 [Pseudomonas fluorescens]
MERDCSGLWSDGSLRNANSLGRGNLSPLGCTAAPKSGAAVHQLNRTVRSATAAQPSGDKSPRHKVVPGLGSVDAFSE